MTKPEFEEILARIEANFPNGKFIKEPHAKELHRIFTPLTPQQRNKIIEKAIDTKQFIPTIKEWKEIIQEETKQNYKKTEEERQHNQQYQKDKNTPEHKKLLTEIQNILKN